MIELTRVCKPAGRAASGTPSPSFAAHALGNPCLCGSRALAGTPWIYAASAASRGRRWSRIYQWPVTCLPMNGHAITISGMVAVAEAKPLLLERDVELARLSALLGNAQAGSGAVVAIGGPAGIGK